MNSIFDECYANEMIGRIKQLRPDSQQKWGKMNVAQMLAHCFLLQDYSDGKLFFFKKLAWNTNRKVCEAHVL